MEKIKGLPTSDGIAIGTVFKWNRANERSGNSHISPDKTEQEIIKYLDALDEAKSQIKSIIDSADGKHVKDIINVQLAICSDPYLEHLIHLGIFKKFYSASKALEEAFIQIEKDFAYTDEYFKERLTDISDVIERILSILDGKTPGNIYTAENIILVAHHLAPSDVATFDTTKVLGFVTDVGGRTSHASILARDMGIPAIVNCKTFYNYAEDGSLIIIDGTSGEIILNPSVQVVDEYKEKQIQYRIKKESYLSSNNIDAVTVDGRLVTIEANVGSPDDISLAAENGAKGIGLFRTEFAIINDYNIYSEDMQTALYMDAIKLMSGHPITIRTYDVGGDKGYINKNDIFEQPNPALGYRGIRYSLDELTMLKSQIRAILRASAHGKVRILFPMIISLKEILACKNHIKQCMVELCSEGLPYDECIEFGIMVETPAAVIMADTFIQHVDFFSIGTNDLTQHILAVDRTNAMVGEMFNIEHPAVIRSIKHVTDVAHKYGRQVEVCGEFTHKRYVALLFLGMDIDRFSMGSGYIPEFKKIFMDSSYEYAKTVAEGVVNLSTVDEVNSYLENMFGNI